MTFGATSHTLARTCALWRKPRSPEPFAEAFTIARDAGLISAPHAGELAGPASVRSALDALGAQRIAHGIRAVDDPSLLARLAAQGVVLDVCPTSNVALGVVESLSAHPLPKLLHAGVRCTLNADDPLLFGPGLLEEYATARTTLALTDHQLAAIARTSIESSGAPRTLAEKAITLIGDSYNTSTLRIAAVSPSALESLRERSGLPLKPA
ncbi:hypothetical protein [Streptomyces sp. NPDC057253]|uniref:hypothetical protein n=1 Tax=Streptomyces sp. NPDC057253 TaxID=3346069 RepID=UPI0036380C7C